MVGWKSSNRKILPLRKKTFLTNVAKFYLLLTLYTVPNAPYPNTPPFLISASLTIFSFSMLGFTELGCRGSLSSRPVSTCRREYDRVYYAILVEEVGKLLLILKYNRVNSICYLVRGAKKMISKLD